ncbi:MAG: penicillin-binding protein 1C [Myxococcaceae bacterium]
MSKPGQRPTRYRRAAAAALLCLLAGAGWGYSLLERRLLTPEASKLILDRRGRYLGEVPGSGGQLGYWPVPYELPEKIRVATLETEDRHFYSHPGVHLPSVGRAAWQNLRNLRVISGASTIAMQVARLQHPGSRSLWRKLTEAGEALLLTREHGHDQLLRQYLTLAPYGNRAHGVVRAARLYFDKPVEDLSWLQASFLAGLPQQPGKMNPYDPAGLKRALARARRILRELNVRGLVNDNEFAVAMKSDLGLVPLPHRNPEAMHAVLEWSAAARQRPAAVSKATLDLEIQGRVAHLLKENLGNLTGAGAGNTAAMVVDKDTGEVLAYVGSRGFFAEEQRGAINFLKAKRSPGSTLKPFIYALALERRGFTAASELADTPLDVQSENGRAFLPENITHSYLGPMLFRDALANSRNIPAMRVLTQVGVEQALQLLERGGVGGISYDPDRYGLGLAIGNLEVTVEELVGLYGALANGGESLPLRRFLDEPAAPRRRVLSRESAQLVTHILADPNARRPSFAAGSPLDFDYAVAVKTGTSQGYRDAWTVAYSDRLLVAVWVGNHDRRRMNHLGGVGAAAGVAHRIMNAVMPLRSPHREWAASFPLPEGYATRDICPLSGKLAGADCPTHRVEAFAPGTEPQEGCPYHAQVAIDLRNGLRAGPRCPSDFVQRRAMLELPEEYSRWARRQRLELAPHQESPLCASHREEGPPGIAIREPKNRVRFLFDPDTPAEYSSIRLSAKVSPASEAIVWIVDGTPVARVSYPHELRWSFQPGTHTIQAAMEHRPQVSQKVTVVVED